MVTAAQVTTWRHGHGPHPEDQVRSVVHLVDSVAFGVKHAARHLAASSEHFAAFPGAESRPALAWNLEHTRRHLASGQEHAEKLDGHVRRHGTSLTNALPDGDLGTTRELAAGVTNALDEAQQCLSSLLRTLVSLEDPEVAARAQVHLDGIGMCLRAASRQTSELVATLGDPALAEEWARLSAANPMPDRASPPPREWIDDFEALLT